jgi:hypothetical protein
MDLIWTKHANERRSERAGHDLELSQAALRLMASAPIGSKSVVRSRGWEYVLRRGRGHIRVITVYRAKERPMEMAHHPKRMEMRWIKNKTRRDKRVDDYCY